MKTNQTMTKTLMRAARPGSELDPGTPMPDQKIIDRVAEAGRAIQAVLKARRGGTEDNEALTEITGLSNVALNASRGDKDVSSYVPTINFFAGCLYSQRRHREYDSKSESGVNFARCKVHAYAERLKHWPLVVPQPDDPSPSTPR